MSTRIYTSDDMRGFVIKAARYISNKYATFGVTQDDAQQEIQAWAIEHWTKIEGWLAADPQRTTRIFRSLVDAGTRYGEKERAARLGYDPDDVHYYTVNAVSGLLPFALDPTFDGVGGMSDAPVSGGTPISQGGGLVTMVMDIRRALDRAPRWVRDATRNSAPGNPTYDDAVAVLLSLLGGASSGLPRRRVRTNASAQAMTRQLEAQ